jgi:acyl-CoA reductase-like NAD-dependent aldehyde dehydrogenase
MTAGTTATSTASESPHQPWVAGRREGSAESFDVRSPYDGSLVGRVAATTPEQVERAVAAAVEVAPRLLALTAAARAAALFHV